MSDITLDSNVSTWQSLNVLSGIAVGSAMVIQNKSTNWFYMVESNTQPVDSSTEGVDVTSLHYNYAVVTTDAGDLEYWVRPVDYGKSVRINVQEA